MSREVQIIVRDDLDGTKAAETVAFSVRGVNYEIDLSEANVELFDKSVRQFLDAARTVVPEKPATRRAMAKLPPNARVAQSRAIRTWARNQGYSIGDKGVIAEPILAAWQLAHPGEKLIPARGHDDELTSVTAQDAQLTLAEIATRPIRDRKGEETTRTRREAIRAWGIENGFEQSAVGVVKKSVIAAYYEAHPEEES